MTAQSDLARRMREAADTLREANKAYDFQPGYGVWNPLQLRREADVLEKPEVSE
jgi:hypothetical protein